MGYEVAKTSEIPIGKMKKVTIEGTEVLVANVDGKYYAVGNGCTHAGGDLSEGSLEGNIVVCPKHGARFDVITGRVISGPKIMFVRPKIKDEPTFKVKVEGQAISVKTS